MDKKKSKIKAISLTEKFRKLNTVWTPHLLADINGQQIRLDKFIGPFFWHKHEEDILYLVFRGDLLIKLENRNPIELTAGEMIVIPKNTNHLPTAVRGAEVIIICSPGTCNTGDVVNEFTQVRMKGV